TGLYLIYILGWAIINPKIAPKLPPDQYRVAVPEYLQRIQGGSRSVVPGLLAAAVRPALARAIGYRIIAQQLLVVSVPVVLTFGTFAATWWYVVIYNAPEVVVTAPARPAAAASVPAPVSTAAKAADDTPAEGNPQDLGAAIDS